MTQHIKPRAATVIIYQGDDMDRLAELNRAVTVAERQLQIRRREHEDGQGAPRRIGDEDSAAEVQAAQAALDSARQDYDAFVDEASERALEIEVRSIGRRRFRDLLKEHPPRQVDSEPDEAGKTRKVDHPEDVDYSVNTETFPTALLAYIDGDHRTIAQPEFGSRADVERFLDDELSEGDVEQLWTAAYMLNRSPSGDPKSLRWSVATETSDETTT